MVAIVTHCPAAPWKLTQRLQEVESVEQDPEVEPEEEEMGHAHRPQICEGEMGGIHLPQTCGKETGDIHLHQPCEQEMADVHIPQKQHLYSTCSFADSPAEELHGRCSLQQLIEYYDRPGPAVPVDSTLGGFSRVRHTEMPGASVPVDSEIIGLPLLPAPVLPPPPLSPELPPSQRTTLDAEVAPDVSLAVNQAQAWDTATATAVGFEQQLLLELDPKADVADKSVADARGQDALSQQLSVSVLPALSREAFSWQATQRRHSIAAPTTSKTMGGADSAAKEFPRLPLALRSSPSYCPRQQQPSQPGLQPQPQQHAQLPNKQHQGSGQEQGFSVGPGNLQRSQSIFDLPEPGLALFAQNSVPTPMRHALQPPRGLDLEKISAGLLPPRGLLNPYMGPATPQAGCWPGVDYSSMRHVNSMATPGCSVQGSMTPPPYFGLFSMAQRSSVEYRRMAVQ